MPGMEESGIVGCVCVFYNREGHVLILASGSDRSLR